MHLHLLVINAAIYRNQKLAGGVRYRVGDMQMSFLHSRRHILLVLALGMSTLIGAGSANALLVSSKPTTPEIQAIRSSARSSKETVDVTVSFSIDSTNTNSPIIQTQVKVGTRTCTANRMATKCTVKAVAAGKNYKVLVRAKNRNGYSAWSPDISFVANSRSSWMRAVASTTTTPPLWSDPEITSVNSLLNVQECRISDVTSTQSFGSSGFPRPGFIRSSFEVEVLVIPVSFTDLIFSDDDVKTLEATYSEVKAFYSSMSYGGASVKMTLAARSSWVNIGGTFEQNGLIKGSPLWDAGAFYRKVIDMYSSRQPISGYDVVQVVSAHSTQFAIDNALSLEITQKSFSGILVLGYDTPRWGAAAHELGHAWLGFEDLYFYAVPQGGDGRFPFGRWDLMSQSTTELSGWTRFLAGWIDPNWVRCASPHSKSRHYLSALNSGKSEDRHRMLVVPVSASVAVVAEYRMRHEWNPFIPYGQTKLVVYRVDTSRDFGNGPITEVGSIDQKGGTVTIDGITISVNGMDKSGVIIEVKN